MKTYRYLFLLALVGFFSCKKSDLELYPYNQIENENVFKTQADVTLAVNGMYAGLRTSGSYFVSGTWNIIADAMADNLIINASGPGRLTLRTFGNWQYTGEDTYGLFTGGYTIVRRANAILENIDNVQDADDAFKNNVKGQALALRGLVYFDMSRVYSKTYMNASPTDWTLPYVTSTDPTITPAVEPVHGFQEKVIKDLEDAKSLIGKSNGLYKLNDTAVSALLSRVYLYKGDWAKVISNATEALGPKPNLPSIANFPSLWKDGETNGSTAPTLGVYFKVKNTKADNVNTPGVNYFQTVSGEMKSEYVVSYELSQLFTANDVRTSSYILRAPFQGNQYNHVVKYAGRPGDPAGVVDGKVIRVAEVLLNRAEAYYRSTPSNPTAALADLKLLKSNRYTGYDPTSDDALSGQALLDEILLQRRLELAFEGDRFWDLKRRNQGITRDPVRGDLANGGGVPYIFTSLPAGDYRWNLPFPQREVNFNPNIKQNDGY